MANGGRRTLFDPPFVQRLLGLGAPALRLNARRPSLASLGVTYDPSGAGVSVPPPLGRPWTFEERRQQIMDRSAAMQLQGQGAWAPGAAPLRTVMYPPSPLNPDYRAEGPVMAPTVDRGVGGTVFPYGQGTGAGERLAMGLGPAGAAGAAGPSIADQFRAFGEGDREGAAGGPFRDPVDDRIDKAWYHAFQAEHDGQTPEEFYTGLPYDQLKYHKTEAGWALDEALDDLEWSRGFRSYSGKDPTDDDWKAWWMHNYGRDMRTDAERKRDKTARKGGPGRKLPRFRGQGQEPEQRPPLFVPPQTFWR